MLSLALLSSCASTPPTPAPAPTANRLTQLIVERLEIAHQVAWIKFTNHLPVRDPKREAELVQRMVADGQAYGLDARTVEQFFRAQIDASCLVQEESLRAWSRGATLPTYPPRDLKRDIRPQLDQIGTQLLQELAKLQKQGGSLPAETYSAIRGAGFSWRVAKTASAPLP